MRLSKPLAGLVLLGGPLLFAAGCASPQADETATAISSLRSDLNAVRSTSDEAMNVAQNALVEAREAKQMAQQALAEAQAASEKADRMFRDQLRK